jgi:hypothetical protein
LGFGPSAVITMKLPLGTRSPTLIAMILSSCFRNEFRPLSRAGHKLAASAVDLKFK